MTIRSPHLWLRALATLVTGLLIAAVAVAQQSPADSSAGEMGGVNPDKVTFDPSIRFEQTRNVDPVIDTIIVVGNQTTRDFVVFQEMELDSGMVATDDAMHRDMERLESLHLFSRAELKLGAMSRGRTALVVEVTELWYIWPGIYFAVDENDPSRTSVGGIVSHDNFRGRRERLSISGRYGYITGFDFRWDLPYLSRSAPQWSMRVEGSYLSEEEPRFLKNREGVESREQSLAARLGYRFNLEDYTWVKATVRSRAFASDNALQDWLTVSDTDRDVLGLVEVGVQKDTRTYKPWPENAYLVKAMMDLGVGLNHRHTSFLQPKLQASIYRNPWERFYLAGRVHGSTYLGSVPTYQRVLLDRENGIRTPMSKVFEGHWRILSSAEFRADLLPVRYVTFKLLEPLNAYTRNLKFGVSSAFFVDHGVVGGVEQPSPFSDSNETDGWDLSYGVGLIVHVPYRDMVRLEVMRSARYPGDGTLVRFRIGTFF